MIKSANGVTGHLLRSIDGTYCFRVYGENYTFVDYDLHHYDLVVTIADEDAAFYRGDGIDRLDHAPATLGIENDNMGNQ
jgi:hypothetical protein